MAFLCVFKNSDQNNICASIVFKAKTKENLKDFFPVFILKLKCGLFWGSINKKKNKIKFYFLKQQISIFENAQQNRYKLPKTAKMAFLTVNNFFLHFQKYQLQNMCESNVFKAESKPKHWKTKFVCGVFFKNQKCTFWGVQNGTF